MQTNELFERGEDKPVSMLGVGLIVMIALPPLIFLFIEAFKVIAPTFGIAASNCSENNFWMSSFYGILISVAPICLIPGLILLGFGIIRLIQKRPFWKQSIAAALVFIPVNIYLSVTTIGWFQGNTSSAIRDNARNELRRLVKAEKRYFSANNAYAEASSQLGDFMFSDTGKILVTIADTGCFRAKAVHECLVDEVSYDSCAEDSLSQVSASQ